MVTQGTSMTNLTLLMQKSDEELVVGVMEEEEKRGEREKERGRERKVGDG